MESIYLIAAIVAGTCAGVELYKEIKKKTMIKCVCDGGILGSNVYLVKTSKLNILVDASRKRYIKHILDNLEKENVKDIDYIIITHSHYDHSEGLYELKKHFGNAKVIIHKSESRLLGNGDFEMPPGSVFYTKFASFCGDILKNRWNFFKYKGVTADIEVEDSFRLEEEIEILHTPGHSKGSLSVIVGTQAIVGDLMYNRMFSPFRKYASFNDDLDQVYRQWERLIGKKCTNFYPGHGSPIDVKVIQKILGDNKKMK